MPILILTMLRLPSLDAIEAINPNIHVLEVQLHASTNALHPMLEEKSTVTKSRVVTHECRLVGLLRIRNIHPSDWLGRDAVKDYYLTRGIATPSQITVKIPLELPEAASGFQVQMVYPN
jgi:hypothetical protein